MYLLFLNEIENKKRIQEKCVAKKKQSDIIVRYGYWSCHKKVEE